MRIADVFVPGPLLYLLLQRVEIWRGEELAQSDVQTVAELFDRYDRKIPSGIVHHAVHRGGRHAGTGRQLVRLDAALLAKLLKASYYCVFDRHNTSPQWHFMYYDAHAYTRLRISEIFDIICQDSTIE